MAPQTCPACSTSALIFSDSALSFICTTCGALLDASQTVIDYSQQTTEGYVSSRAADPATRSLKGPDGQVVWGLQTAEAKRHLRRADGHRLIRDLLIRLGHPSDILRQRAQTLFDAAQERAHFAWGSVHAEVVAGAACAAALRETDLPESLGEIAACLSHPPITLSRTYTRLKRVLCLSLRPADPHVYLPTLSSRLASALSNTAMSDAIPKATREHLMLPSYTPVLNFASKVLYLMHRTDLANGRHAGPVACAALLLSIESERRKPMPHMEKVAALLASGLGVGTYTVLERYREISKLVDILLERLPCITDNQVKSNRSRKGVERLAWLPDVVRMGEMLWKRRLEARGPLDGLSSAYAADNRSELDISDEEFSDAWAQLPEGDDDVDCSSSRSSTASSLAISAPASPSHKRKRMDSSRATFAPASLSHKRIRMESDTQSQRPSFVRPSRPRGSVASPNGLVSAALSLFDSSFPDTPCETDVETRALLLNSGIPITDLEARLVSADPASRLTRLAWERGGEEGVLDDELFEEDELEGYLRNATDVKALQAEVEWNGMWQEPLRKRHGAKKRDVEERGEKAGKRSETKRAINRLLHIGESADVTETVPRTADGEEWNEWVECKDWGEFKSSGGEWDGLWDLDAGLD